MATRSLVNEGASSALDLGDVGRRAALLAAGLTIGSGTALAVFFAVGEPWGTINDTLSIGLAWATVPIALDLARRHPGSGLLRLGVASDLVGVATVTLFTSLLISRRSTFEESLLQIMIGQAFIGGWLVLAGVSAWADPGSRRTASLGITGGAGLMAMAAAIAAGGMESSLAAPGFIASLIGTLGFYALLGRRPAR